YVRFAPESGQIAVSLGMSALCQSRPNALQQKTSRSPRRRGRTPRVSLNGIYGISCSLRLDACELDHLAPLLGLFSDELCEVGGGPRNGGPAQNGKPRLELGIGEGGVNLSVELVDNFHGRGLGNSNAKH